MLRMFVGADIDLFHCVDARRAMGREKAFGSALAPSLTSALTTVPEVVIVLAADPRSGWIVNMATELVSSPESASFEGPDLYVRFCPVLIVIHPRCKHYCWCSHRRQATR